VQHSPMKELEIQLGLDSYIFTIHHPFKCSPSAACTHANQDLHASPLEDVPVSDVKAAKPMKGGFVVRVKCGK
ncbi:MAG: hypothetical protein MJE68_16560, partial [Proteobacteria bacterium]|nr:hypothetical protein [Pseudomonadota bacterium]